MSFSAFLKTSFSVWLCGLYYGALHDLKSPRGLCPRVFFIPFSIVITSLGEEGGWPVCF